MKFGNVLKKTALAAMLAGSALVAMASPSEARVVCNRWHCWHTHYGYYDPYYDPYYEPSYYGPGYYGGPGVTFGFNFGGGHYHGGGHHGGGGHHH